MNEAEEERLIQKPNTMGLILDIETPDDLAKNISNTERNKDLKRLSMGSSNGEQNQNERRDETWLDCIPYYSFTNDLFNTFDKPFLFMLFAQNLNHGLWMMAILATQDYFKNYLHLDPGQMTVYISIIHLPWSIKILYGLVSDNLPVFGTRRKSYIIIMGIIQSISLLYLFIHPKVRVMGVVFALTTACFTEAFVNVVADAIMVIQSRKDPVNGSQNLVSFSYFSISIGSIIGCMTSGYII